MQREARGAPAEMGDDAGPAVAPRASLRAVIASSADHAIAIGFDRPEGLTDFFPAELRPRRILVEERAAAAARARRQRVAMGRDALGRRRGVGLRMVGAARRRSDRDHGR